MLGVAANFLTGAAVKVVAGALWKFMEHSRETRMASMNADTNRIVQLQSGTDVSDPYTRTTRRIIALSLVWLWCFVIIWVVVAHPETNYSIMIDKHRSFLLSWLIGGTDKTVLDISAGSLLWDTKNLVEILIGFYFTKFGK